MANIGDRIYFKYYDDTIGSAVILGMEDRKYDHPDGEFNFKMYKVGSHSKIEDYNCLPEDDPRVQEYIKKNKKNFEFEDKFREFMKDYDIKSDIVSDCIRKYLSE